MFGVFNMYDNFLQPIYNESDLTVYESYINSPEFKTVKNESFSSFLNGSIGKTVKIYMVVGNQLTARQGKLSGVFCDYLTLTQNREKIAVKLCEIKFIVVM